MNDQLVNIKLVGEVEKYPVLYNFKLPGYTKKDETEKAWSEVAKEVKMSVPDCKERWKNLRAVFVRNMKPLKNGSGAKGKKAYYLLEAMQFAVPYIKALGPYSTNLPNPKREEAEHFVEIYYENNDAEEPKAVSPSQEWTLSSPSMSLPQSVKTTATSEVSQKQLQSSGVTRNKRALKNDAVDKAFIGYSHSKRTKFSDRDDQSPKIEGLKMFLLSMIPDLLKMSDEQVRQFKRKALDVVDDILSSRPMISPQLSFSSRCTTPSSCSEIPLAP